MNGCNFSFAGTTLTALGSGALYWPAQNLLCVSDLHLGKSGRRARLGDAPLPPYETRDTLARLQTALRATRAETVICLGDSFDDPGAAADLPEDEKLWIAQLQAGRKWIWIEGNHDPGPVDLGGSHLSAWSQGPITFRHIADSRQKHEISGHYHPKLTITARGGRISRKAFLFDENRAILPAFGTYTGGLRGDSPDLRKLLREDAMAILTGPTPHLVPMQR